MIEVLDDIYQGIEDKNMIEIMTLDQSSAFDCVNFTILIEKLKKYKIGENARKWITSYLNDRTQYVEIGGVQSRMVPVNRGVPQGSVIGPLLYAIYTNELTETIKSPNCQNISHQESKNLFGIQCNDCGTLSMYADDLTYTTSNTNRTENQTKIETNLKKISQFLNDNHLVINQTKTTLTECMISQKKGKTNGIPPSMLVEKEPGVFKLIENCKYTRILGANIEGNMLWNSHLETGLKALLPMVRKQLGQLKHLGGLIPKKSKMNLARGLILGRLCYLMPLWGGSSSSQLRKVQVLVNSTARWITGMSRKTRISKLMEQIGWLDIREQIILTTAVITWKMIYLNKPARPMERLTITQDLRIQVEEPRLLFSEECFRWRSARIWNDIPLEIRQIGNVVRFKKHLRKWILLKRTIPPDE